MLYAADGPWWEVHGGVREFGGLKVTATAGAAIKHGLLWLNGACQPGLSDEQGFIHYGRKGRNSGYQAINVVTLLGAARVLLLGYDMQRTDGRAHFFGEHPDRLRRASNFADFIQNFATLVDPLRERGIEIINCTPGSALPWFPTANLEDVL